MDKILVFIPVYNCQAQITRVLATFDESIKDLFAEILIVDNRSTDKTLEICKQTINDLPDFKVTLIQNASNYNLGGSHKVAFNYAIEHEYDYVIILHGDDQGNIHDIVDYIKQGEHRHYDCLLGARFMKNSCLINYSKIRTLGNIFFNYFFSIACGKKLYDLGAGLNIYKVSFIKDKFYLRFPNALTFNYYMIFYTVAIKAKFKYFPLTWKEEDQISNVKLLKQTKQLLKVITIYCMSRDNFVHQWHERKREYPYYIIDKSMSID